MTVSQSLFLITLVLLKNTGQLFCRMALSLYWSDVFSWLDWGYGTFGKEWHRVMLCPFQPIVPVEYDINMLLNFIIWLRWCMPDFSAIKLLRFVFIINVLLGGYFETRQISCFSLYLHLLILTSIGDSCWKSLFLCYLTSSDLLFPSILLCLLIVT